MHKNGQNEGSDWSPSMTPGSCLVNQRKRSDEPQEKEADARPAASER